MCADGASRTFVLYVSLLTLSLTSCSPCAKRHLLPYEQRPTACQLRHISVLYSPGWSHNITLTLQRERPLLRVAPIGVRVSASLLTCLARCLCFLCLLLTSRQQRPPGFGRRGLRQADAGPRLAPLGSQHGRVESLYAAASALVIVHRGGYSSKDNTRRWR